MGRSISEIFENNRLVDKILVPIIIGVIAGIIANFISNVFIPNLNNQKVYYTNNISIVAEASQSSGTNANSSISESDALKMIRNNVNLERSQTIRSLGWALIAFTVVVAFILAYVQFRIKSEEKGVIIIGLSVSWFVFLAFVLSIMNDLGLRLQSWL